MVGLRRTPPSAPPRRASVTSASAVYCCHSRTAPACLSSGALGLGDVPDRLLEGGALLERQAPAEHQLAPPARPGHAQRATLVQRLVVLHRRRGERARGKPDRAGRLAERDARQLGIALRRRELRRGCDLIERQRASAERVVERGQLAQRVAGVCDAHGGAVVAARDLREPLRARGASRGLPITLVVGLTHDLRQPLRQTRLLLADRRTSRRRASRRRSST